MGKKFRTLTIFCILGCILCNFSLAEITTDPKSDKRGKLEIKTLKAVECKENEKVKKENVVRIHYKMSVVGSEDITESTYDKEQGVVYVLQDGMMLKGFVKALPGMCIGEIRELTIPPHLAFGSKGTDIIPGGATVKYEVELIDIMPVDDVIKQFYKADLNLDGTLDIQELDDIMKVALEKGNFPSDPEIRKGMINQIFLLADKDKDGGISAEEFRTLLKLQNNSSSKRRKQEL